jgi:hypothetical protein
MSMNKIFKIFFDKPKSMPLKNFPEKINHPNENFENRDQSFGDPQNDPDH